jgi:DNA-directed RNA polymerase specialized sigma24 family protein
MSAFPGGRYGLPEHDWGKTGPANDSAEAQDLGSGQRRVESSALTWMDLDEGQSKILKDHFVYWFTGDGNRVLHAAGHSIAGREGNELAADAAVKCYEQWPDPRKRELFRGSPRYAYQVARNLFLDQIKVSHNRKEIPAGLPGHSSLEEGSTGTVWDKGKDDRADPDWEVRFAVNSLDDEKSELIFLVYWLRMSRLKAAEYMGITRRQADRLHESAMGELRALLE